MRRRMPRYADLPIRVKLLAPFLVVMVVWGGLGSYVLARSAVTEARGRATTMLAESLDGSRAAFADAERALIETVRLSANTQGVAEALARSDHAQLQRLLVPLSLNANANMDVVLRNGALVERINRGKPETPPGPPLRHPSVLKAARGARDDRGSMWNGLTEDSFFVAGPVRDRTNRAIGAIVVNESLDRLAGRMSRGNTAGVTIFSSAGATLASSTTERMPFRASGSGLRAEVRVDDAAFEVLYGPLESRGERVGDLAVAIPSSKAMGSARRTAITLTILAGLAAAAAAVVGLFSARAIRRPLHRLGDVARAMEHGDLQARARISSKDEVGRLASAFDTMANELEASHRGLEEKVARRTADLARANEELMRASAAKSAFVATMSHELRTPLNAINGFAEMLADPMFGKPSLKTTRELGGHIAISGRHLLTLINDMLDLAKVEAGKIEIRPEPTDLVGVMHEVLAVVRPLSDQNGLRLSMKDGAEAPLVEVDPARLRQILFNLFANAIKFTPEGGNVQAEIEAGNGSVTVSVIDDGPGLAEGEAARIFEPFERGRASRTVEGAGLGLTLARHLVELQGGRIWVTSRRGRGSRFSFTIPVAGAGGGATDAQKEERASA